MNPVKVAPKLESATVMAPNNADAEESVLGSILIDSAVLAGVERILSPSDFFTVKNGWIFEALIELEKSNLPVDFTTLCNRLEERVQLAEVGGAAYISHLINVVVTAIHAEGYALIVKRMAIRREALALASEIAERAYDQDQVEPMELLDHLVVKAQKIRLEAASRMMRRVSAMSASEIMAMDFPEPFLAVQDMLTSGLCFIGGKPKRGKSWLALQLACAIASPTGNFIGKQLQHGPVLYLALEDSARRLKSRMNRQMWPEGLRVDFIASAQFRDEIGNLAAEGADRIGDMMLGRGYRMAVVDTFAKSISMFLETGEVYDAGAMTRALAKLQEFAIANDRVILMVAHHTKAVPETHDPITDILGSIGIGATIDTAWGLYRERGQQVATLMVTGRDLEEELSMIVRFDRETCTWQYEGNAGDLMLTEQRLDILQTLEVNGRMALTDLSELIGKDKGNTSKRVGDLVTEGMVQKIQCGSGSKSGKWTFEITDEGRIKLDEMERAVKL